MQQDPFGYDFDEITRPERGSSRPLVLGLVAMLGIGVLSAMVLMEPPMSTTLEVTDQARLERMLNLAPPPADVARADRPSVSGGALDGAGAPDASHNLDPVLQPAEPVITFTTLEDPATGPGTDAPLNGSQSSYGGDGGNNGADSVAPVRVTRPVSALERIAPLGDADPSPTPRETTRPRPSQAASAAVPALSATSVPRLGQAADGPFAIQIGAMSTRAKAEQQIARMRRDAPALFASVETSIETTRLDDGRTVNRMRIPGITRKADARSWCTTYKAQGGSCYVIG